VLQSSGLGGLQCFGPSALWWETKAQLWTSGVTAGPWCTGALGVVSPVPQCSCACAPELYTSAQVLYACVVCPLQWAWPLCALARALKGKILDFWRHGAPVVTTPVGAEGLTDGAPDPPRYGPVPPRVIRGPATAPATAPSATQAGPREEGLEGDRSRGSVRRAQTAGWVQSAGPQGNLGAVGGTGDSGDTGSMRNSEASGDSGNSVDSGRTHGIQGIEGSLGYRCSVGSGWEVAMGRWGAEFGGAWGQRRGCGGLCRRTLCASARTGACGRRAGRR